MNNKEQIARSPFEDERRTAADAFDPLPAADAFGSYAGLTPLQIKRMCEALTDISGTLYKRDDPYSTTKRLDYKAMTELYPKAKPPKSGEDGPF